MRDTRAVDRILDYTVRRWAGDEPPIDIDRSPLSLASEPLSVAIALTVLGRDHDAAVAASRALNVAARRCGTSPAATELFDGLVPLALALRLRMGSDGRPSRTLEELDRRIVAGAEKLLEKAQTEDIWPTAFHHFDVINGLAGLSQYLATAGRLEVLSRVVEQMCTLCRRRSTPLGYVPAWIVDHPPQIPEPPSLSKDPHVNLGMAHGGAGILAALSRIAIDVGEVATGHIGAVRWLTDWYVSQEEERTGLPIWPTALFPTGSPPASGNKSGLGPLTQGTTPTEIGLVNASWCYGSPGIACALSLAGSALADDHVTRIASRVGEAWLRSEFAGDRSRGDGICHGAAGTLHVLRRLGANSEETEARLSLLADAINCDLSFDAAPDLSLLDGLLGQALVLTDGEATKDGMFGPSWELPFLMPRRAL